MVCVCVCMCVCVCVYKYIYIYLCIKVFEAIMHQPLLHAFISCMAVCTRPYLLVSLLTYINSVSSLPNSLHH